MHAAERAPGNFARVRYCLYATLCLALFFLSWTALTTPRHRWLTRAANYLILSDPPEKADLIVVLGGDFWGPRVIRAAELGMQGFAPRVLISGPRYGNGYEGDYAIRFLVERGYPRSLFVSYPISATSTIGEALELKRAFETFRARHLLIVTSDYHTRRASIVFRGLVPGYEYRFIPAADVHLVPTSWWTKADNRQYFYAEWRKIIGTLLEASWLGHL